MIKLLCRISADPLFSVEAISEEKKVTVEKATRDELAGLSEPVRTSATAEVAVELARRLDCEPADSVAVLLARELRLAMADLHKQSGEVNDDLEQFLAGSRIPRFAAPATERESNGAALAGVARQLVGPVAVADAGVCRALEHVDGHLAYRDVAVGTPRQSGKSSLVLSLIVYRMLSAPSQRLVYGAQTRLAARVRGCLIRGGRGFAGRRLGTCSRCHVQRVPRRCGV